MKAIEFDGANGVLRVPCGVRDCVDMPVRRADGWVLSVWELTPDEIAQLIAHRRIAVQVLGGTHPPLTVWVPGADGTVNGVPSLDS